MVAMTAPALVHPHSVFVARSLTYAALAFQGYEWIMHLHLEIQQIWSEPFSSIPKWIYLFSRYFGLFTQILNAVFSTRVQGKQSVPVSLCRNWQQFLLYSTQLTLLAFEVILARRLFTLYKHSTFIHTFLTSLLTLKFAATTSLAIDFLRRTVLQGPCTVREPSLVSSDISVIHITGQIIIWALTIAKWRVPTRTVSRVIRDGSLSFASIAILFVGFHLSQIQYDIAAGAQCLYPVYCGILTTVNCRMIHNMRAPPDETQIDSSTVVELGRVLGDHDEDS